MPVRERRRYGAQFGESLEWQGDCLVWTAAVTAGGYGNYWDGERNWQAHRFHWTIYNGAIPDEIELHHDCHNKLCCCLDHLIPVTAKEHRVLDFEYQTHCLRGHELTPDNTYIRNKGNGVRQCRACHALLERERRTVR